MKKEMKPHVTHLKFGGMMGYSDSPSDMRMLKSLHKGKKSRARKRK